MRVDRIDLSSIGCRARHFNQYENCVLNLIDRYHNMRRTYGEDHIRRVNKPKDVFFYNNSRLGASIKASVPLDRILKINTYAHRRVTQMPRATHRFYNLVNSDLPF